MTAKPMGRAPSRSAPPATEPLPVSTTSGRKPWKKKTPVEVVLDQIAKVREDVEERERELAVARRQLEKLEDAAKLLEST